MNPPLYRIVPGMLFRFHLHRRVGWSWLGFWMHVSSSDRYDELAESVRLVGGRLPNDRTTALQQEPKP